MQSVQVRQTVKEIMGQAKFWRLAGITGIFIGGGCQLEARIVSARLEAPRCSHDLSPLGRDIPEVLHPDVWTTGRAEDRGCASISFSSFAASAASAAGPI